MRLLFRALRGLGRVAPGSRLPSAPRCSTEVPVSMELPDRGN
jgi:hypothetical protein